MIVRELINKAWYLSGAVARDLGQVNGSQGIDGLFLLNSLLDEQNITGRYIPVDDETIIPCVVGQQEYAVDNLIILHELTFIVDTVRYPMRRQTRKQYFAGGRAENITSLPYYYFFERKKDTGNIFLYFNPDKTYPLHINGRFALTDVLIDDELDDVLNKFYQHFLMYGLAEYMAGWYQLVFPEKNKEILERLRKGMPDINNMDFTANQISTFGSSSGFNYGIVNLARSGFLPP